MSLAISYLGSLVGALGFLLAFLSGVEVCAAEVSMGQVETEDRIDLLGVPPSVPSLEDRSDPVDSVSRALSPETKDNLLFRQVGCVRGELLDGSGVEGSGFMIAPEYFLTSAHGVRQTQRLRVRFHDGSNDVAHPATLLSVSPALDLALLHLPTWKATPLPFLRSNSKSVGEKVSAVGCPLGRALEISTGETRANDKALGMEGLIRSRLVVQPGNSGGPLLNQVGEVLGMILWSGKDRQGEAFALPMGELEGFLGESFFQMGVLLADVGRYADAVEVSNHGIYFTPESAKAYNNLGQAFRMMGEGKRSEEALRKSLSLQPDHAEAHYNLALLYKNLLDHPAKAAIHFRRYLYLRPTAPESVQIGQWLTALSAASSNAEWSSGRHARE
jgi:S1-C subfamily serine protease